MSRRKMFTESDLVSAFSAAGAKCKRKISVYLIGGCAMTFIGRKVATKDIDVVLSSAADAKDFTQAMERAGFTYVKRLPGEHNALGATAIMKDAKGMRFDIFVQRVCRALEFSHGMKSRARFYRTFSNLDVYVMSPEDIFLFKGITERDADLDDMRILAEAGLDWKTVETECLSQKRNARWAYMLGTKLDELRTSFGITSPIVKTLMDHADLDLLTYAFGNIIDKREVTFREVARAVKEKYGYSESWTRKQLASFIRKRIISAKKKERPQVYSMTR